VIDEWRRDPADAFAAHLEHIADGLMTDSPAIVAQANARFDALKADAYRRSESLALKKRWQRNGNHRQRPVAQVASVLDGH
jgi:hypothetical protein